MQKINTLMVFISAALLSSCDAWLTESPKNIITKNNFYQTEEDAESAIIGAYNSMSSDYFGITYYLMEELHGDFLTGRGTQAPISSFNMLLNQMCIDRAGQCWESLYRCINRSNAVLDNVLPSSIDPAVKERVAAEAYFLRAMSYFNLIRAFGPVPLRLHEVTDEADLAAARTPVETIYSQMESDLAIAEKGLPDDVGTKTGRATRWAAKMLLAQIYLDQEKWAECADKCDEIIMRGKYSLVPVEEPDDFYNLYNNDTNSEDIMSMHHSLTKRAEITFYLHAPDTPPYNYSGAEGVYAWLPRTEGNSIIGASWDDNDLRKTFNLYTQYQDEEGEWVDNVVNPTLFKKFITTEEGTAINTIPIYRYAEALLMYAEAAYMSDSHDDALALERMNMVRRRGYGRDISTPYPAIDCPSGLSKEEFMTEILKERVYEFLLERRRWWDLKRTGTIQEAFANIGITYIEERLLWPIPLAEIQNNPLIGQEDQNPGY